MEMEPLPAESVPNPYRTDNAGLRRDARRLLEIAPEPQKREMLFHLADFHPEPTDLPVFVGRYQAGDSNALALIVKLWPGEESVRLIERALENGLSASFEDLMFPNPEKAGAFKETPLGRQVGCAISLGRNHLPLERVIHYFIRYLEHSPDPALRAQVAGELGEIGGTEAGEALARAAATAEGRVLSDVAEAIQKVPTPEGLENLFSRLPDRTLRLDRGPVIDTLIELRPDERLRDRLFELTQEPGCRCAACVWRRALRKLASTWPDERSRSIVEDFFQKEPGYEGRIGAARILAAHWPDERTIELLRKGTERPVSGAGEGDRGHLPFDGKTDLSKGDRDEETERHSSKLARALWSVIDEIKKPPTKESESSIQDTEMIRQMLIREAARRSST